MMFIFQQAISVRKVGRVTSSVSVSRQVSANIALEALMIRPAALMGLLCTVVQRPPLLPPVADAGHGEGVSVNGSPQDTLLNFRCHTVNVSGSPMGQLSQVRVITNQPMCPKTIELVIVI